MAKAYYPLCGMDTSKLSVARKTRAPHLVIPKTLNRVLEEICKLNPSTEWTSFGILQPLETSPNIWILTNIIAPDKMTGSGGNTEVDASSYSEILSYLCSAKDLPEGVSGPQLACSVKLWIHSHHSMGVFWSATDQKAIADLGGHLLDPLDRSETWFMHLVVNNRGEKKSCISGNTPVPYVTDVNVTVLDFDVPMRNIPSETSDKLTNLRTQIDSIQQTLTRERDPLISQADEARKKAIEEAEQAYKDTVLSISKSFSELENNLQNLTREYNELNASLSGSPEQFAKDVCSGIIRSHSGLSASENLVRYFSRGSAYPNTYDMFDFDDNSYDSDIDTHWSNTSKVNGKRSSFTRSKNLSVKELCENLFIAPTSITTAQAKILHKHGIITDADALQYLLKD